MTTQNATSISRKRSSPAVSCPDLQKLRIQTWYKHLLERAVEDEVTRYADIAARRAAFGSEEVLPDLNMALQKWLNEQVQKNLHRLTLEESELVLRLRRSRYDEGKSTPTAMTIRLCELLLEGSAAVYDVGPGNLPLWRVLDGDVKACKAYVQDMLNPSPERWNQGFDEIVQEVFDALIAPAYRLALDAIPVLGVPQREAHPVWLSYINSMYAATLDDDEADKLPETFMQVESVLLAIAMMHIAAERPDSPALQLEWLLVGLCWGVIGQQMDEPIQEYVLKSVEKRGKAIDARLRRSGARMPGFEERWPVGIAP